MVTDREIARWRLRSQRLAAPSGDAEQVVRSSLAVQAENPSQSAWAVATRTAAPSADNLAGALADGRVLRTHILRSTWHYVCADDVRWLQALTVPRVMPVYESQLRPIADRLAALAGAVEAALAEASARPGQGTQPAEGARPTQGTQPAPAALTRPEIATALAERGEPLTGQPLGLLMAWLEVRDRVTSGPPRDGEHTYSLFDARVPASKPIDRDAALAEVALRYFTSHGPATERDLAYWATLTVTDVRRGIAGVGDRLSSFEHDGREFWHARDDEPAPATTSPPAHLLQMLDEMYRGYQDSRMVIDAEGLVASGRETSMGMALVDGQLLAGMKRVVGPSTVTFELRPYRALRQREVAAIRGAAKRYGAFLGLVPQVEIEG